MLGDKSNLLPRRQEDLELPMSPIRNPSNLNFLDSKTEMDTQTRHIPHQLHKPDSCGGQAKDFKLPLPISNSGGVLSNQVEYSDTILPLPTSRDANESRLSEPLLPFYNTQEHLSLSKHQRHIRHHSPPQVCSCTYCLHGLVLVLIVAGEFKA